MSAAHLPTGLAAAIDRDVAELRQLVESARHHTDAMACEHVGVCAGGAVSAVLQEMQADELDRLLYLAIARLATTDYGRDLDHPARALLAGLEPPRGDDDDRG